MKVQGRNQALPKPRLSASALSSLALFLISTACAQTIDSKDGGSGAPRLTGAQQGATEVSIESEMLTYEALEAASQIVADDVTRLFNADSGERRIAILLPGSPTISQFRTWRAVVAEMTLLSKRMLDTHLGPTAGGANTSVTSGALKLSPVDVALGNTLGLVERVFTTLETTTPVQGDVPDQAFAGAVARQLRTHSIYVLVPDVYEPHSLAAGNYDQYTITSRLLELEADRAILRSALRSPNKLAPEQLARAQTLLTDIEAFIAGLLGLESTQQLDPGKAQLPSKPPSTPQSADQRVVNSTASGTLGSLLDADLLASELGVNPGQASLDTPPRQYILWLKSLESGGTVVNREKFLTKDTMFTGGFVGTYDLFNVKGALVCSGTVTAYAGPMFAKDLTAPNGLQGAHVVTRSTGKCPQEGAAP